MSDQTQATVIGLPAPKTWDEFETNCLACFHGGYQTAGERSAFSHGMQTVFNLLRREFKEASECRKMKHPCLVNATNLDSVRIEVLGGSRAVTIPANLVLAADAVFREACMDVHSQLILQVEQSPEGPMQWAATIHGKVGYSMTPWGAVKELADKLEASNGR